MKRGTVLVADSHSPMLEGVRSLLEERFASIVMVADESSLLHTAEKLQPNLAVIDVSFPVAGTKSAVAVLHERYPDMQLIALSIHDDPVVVERVVKSGASAFVLKRCATTDLVPALEEVSVGHVYISPDARAGIDGPYHRNHGSESDRASKQD